MTTHSVQPTPATQPLRPDLRVALAPGLLMIFAGAVQGDGAIITAIYRNVSPISDEQLSFPWDGATAITTSLIWGITQVLIVIGLTAFARSGAAPTTAGRVGGRLAVAGAVLYVIAHALSLVAYDAALDDPISVAVLSCFGIGTLLTAVGLVIAGTATLRSGAWSGWRRYTPLILGAWMVAMMPLQFTPALPLAVGIYALAVMGLGLALIVEGLGWEPRS
ncbi:hypothetical protein [Nocardioides okcheonensis]|uniref:hypothetical protein n=1 Tax=Nocardioides okcheonensis TaxID=2894081 RepID=UPI001E3F637C|nr:hypothetical protein [Nocardioides okcheonensis]UFN45168.1 hypothetical protein LN652_02845 [Nocardioides okcheonensis]